MPFLKAPVAPALHGDLPPGHHTAAAPPLQPRHFLPAGTGETLERRRGRHEVRKGIFHFAGFGRWREGRGGGAYIPLRSRLAVFRAGRAGRAGQPNGHNGLRPSSSFFTCWTCWTDKVHAATFSPFLTAQNAQPHKSARTNGLPAVRSKKCVRTKRTIRTQDKLPCAVCAVVRMRPHRRNPLKSYCCAGCALCAPKKQLMEFILRPH